LKFEREQRVLSEEGGELDEGRGEEKMQQVMRWRKE